MKWELPGGKVEEECLVEAAYREQMEESGMQLRGSPAILGVIETFGHTDKTQRFVCVIMLWRGWSGFPKIMEQNTLQWRWFKLNKLPALEVCTPGTVEFITKILPPFIERMKLEQEEDHWDGQDIEPLPFKEN